MQQQIFNQNRLYHNLKRFNGDFIHHNVIHQLVHDDVSERLCDIKDNFDNFIISSLYGLSSQDINKIIPYHSHVKQLIYQQKQHEEEFYNNFYNDNNNAILSLLTAHVVNDLLGVFCQYQLSLKKQGILLGAMFGANTLRELRQIFVDTDIALYNGATPHISPLPQWQDIGAILQKAKFVLPVIDRQFMTLRYKNLRQLLYEWRILSGGNIRYDNYKRFIKKEYFKYAEALYYEKFSDNNRLTVTVEIIYFHGWKP